MKDAHAREQAMQEVVVATDRKSMELFQQLSQAHACMNDAVAAKDKLAAEVEKLRQSLTVRDMGICTHRYTYVS